MITGNRDEAREFGRRTMEIAERCRFDYFQLLGTQYVLMPEPDRPVAVADLEQYALGMDLVGHGAFRPDPPRHRGAEPPLSRRRRPGAEVPGRGAGAVGVLGRARAPTRPAAPPGRDHLPRRIPSGWTRRPPICDAAVDIGLAQGSLVLALRAANDLARLPHDRPPDWADRLRAVLERFPHNSSSPEFAQALDLLEV